MSFELCFSPDFFYSEGDDHFGMPDNQDTRPQTVYQAIKVLAANHDRWFEMCKDVFPHVPASHVDCGMVMDKIRETNSCRDLRSPVKVYIDEGGWHSVEVY